MRPSTLRRSRCGSYEELLASDTVDAVYVPLPTGIRKAWSIRAAEAGKHVLSEKPVAATAEDVREILAACRRNGVQFMDGVMFMHSRRLDRIREVLNDGQSVGQIRRIVSQFSFGGAGVLPGRHPRPQRPGAAGLPRRPGLVLHPLHPVGAGRAVADARSAATCWPATDARTARRRCRPSSRPSCSFPSGVSASFYCSFLTEIQQWASVGGTKGSIHVPDFVLPQLRRRSGFEVSNPVYHVTGCDFNMEDHRRRVAVREYSNGAPELAGSEHVPQFRGAGPLGQAG